MLRSMITAANTMNQLHQQLDVISHNIANINTTGYKKREATFGELLVQQFDNLPAQDEAPRLTPNGIRQGVGAKLASTNIQLKQGSIMKSDRPLDLAFTKEGQFFRVLVDENGTQTIRYTRDGAFYFSPSAADPDELMLVTADGHMVLDSNNEPILIRDGFKEIQITPNGTINVIDPNGNIVQTEQLGVTTILRPQLLQSVGDNLLALPDGVNEADVAVDMTGNLRGQIQLQQYALEQSNVELATEMSELMITQRSYQMNARAITLSDQMMGLINGIRS
ncbi:flagellar basal-body rod protein FlgG [Thermolongibacillus altinsuensis]|uniref:Flagellar basal-body rod protein FlgG n=1 Tax=Thermolongibacillus altinsuensis TaxID=575256 RepID=A0A4R1QRT7_9BACL|nr:flagellar hook-basal body protein [Thermolongibacillus altinsuensis]TCL52760.1 flagellar basal-body rod protein FlgG [Thermolongibacillus altinsuensis]GMB09404.1 flagellar hook-basal body complex protein FlhP [Thermolongibacillus altinsuensis]